MKCFQNELQLTTRRTRLTYGPVERAIVILNPCFGGRKKNFAKVQIFIGGVVSDKFPLPAMSVFGEATGGNHTDVIVALMAPDQTFVILE